MFTIYNLDTLQVVSTIKARTAEIAYRNANLKVDQLNATFKCDSYVFDDTCEHGTAFDLCIHCVTL